MRSFLVHGILRPSELVSTFRDVTEDVQTSMDYSIGGAWVVVLVGRKFFLRTNDYLGVILLAASDGTTQRIDVGFAGGPVAVSGFLWGPGPRSRRN